MVPISWNYVSRKRAPKDRSRVIPACSNCNNLLGSKPLFTIRDRAIYLHAKLQKKYYTTLSLPDWTNEELEELEERTLRMDVVQSLRERDILRERLKFLYIVITMDPSIEDVWKFIVES